MQERKTTDFTAKRMLSVLEAAAYLGLGKSYTRSWAEEVGAVRHIGRRVLIDRAVIDKALDSLTD